MRRTSRRREGSTPSARRASTNDVAASLASCGAVGSDIHDVGRLREWLKLSNNGYGVVMMMVMVMMVMNGDDDGDDDDEW